MAREDARPARGGLLGLVDVAVLDGLADVAEVRARQHDQRVGLVLLRMQRGDGGGQRFQPFDADLGAALVLVGQPRLGQQLAQLQVAGVVLGEDEQAERLFAVVVVGDPRVHADHGLDALAARGLVETHHAKQVGQVGDGQRGLLVLDGGGDQVVDAYQAVDDRILRVHAQVHEGWTGRFARCGLRFTDDIDYFHDCPGSLAVQMGILQ